MDFGIEQIIECVKDNLHGRFADACDASSSLLHAVQVAGDGNYLELGVLHGGSLIATALLKNSLGHKGCCVGVDLFDGWYGNENDRSGMPVNLKMVKDNITAFGLENVELVQTDSKNFEPLDKYSVVYVDADHTESGCWRDWLLAKSCSTRFVIFHDYLLIKGVTKACERAMDDPNWKVYESRKGVLILEKIEV